jgi:RHS repeat-associated protein
VKPKTGGFDVFYVWSDNLGTPRQITDASNVSRWEWATNDPFGNNAPNENPASVGTFSYNLRFPGQYYDVEMAKHYNYFRDYDPSTGRYLQSDPIGLTGGLNTYAYVLSSPLRRADPRGLDAYDSWPHPPPPQPDDVGNYSPGFEPQDQICTLPGSIGTAANSNKCILKCCQVHDDCYTKYRCNASSWEGNLDPYGVNRPCQKCNAAARKCIVKAISKGCPACTT